LKVAIFVSANCENNEGCTKPLTSQNAQGATCAPNEVGNAEGVACASNEVDNVECVTSDTFSTSNLLPKGIVRATAEAIAAERLLKKCPPVPNAQGKFVIAAFDFDGTCLSTSSPRRLVMRLVRSRKLGPWKILRIGLWGAAYKINFPKKDAEGVRERVFTAFNGTPAPEVNQYMHDFYEEVVSEYFREDARACMMAHLDAGHVVLLVSASFEPIVAAAMTEQPIQFALASRMKVDARGRYLNQVEGTPTEGPGKMQVLEHFANEYFGPGAWEIGWAYGDHFSDVDLLSAAKNPCAVTPDQKLKKHAQKHHWSILNWQ
jgi:HAD superfamily hydrolase (TIGR01490 family)